MVARVGTQLNPGEKPVPDFCSLLLLLPLPQHSQVFLLQMLPKHTADPSDKLQPGSHCGNRWVWKTLLWTSKENASPEHCANRIFTCVREIKKRLEVFLHSLSLPPSPLSLYLVLAVSRRLLVQ